MHLSLCICAEVPSLSVATTVRLVIHRREALRTTNTGKLATRCLHGGEVLVHGRRDASLAPAFDLRGPALVLFPSDTAEPLSRHHVAGPDAATLYVPDGSWRQASRMLKQLPWLAEMQHVCLPPGGPPSIYRLRSGRNADDLSTAEAIARAMGILHDVEVQHAIERVLRIMIERTLFSRGQLAASSVFGGIPAGVMAHNPRPPLRSG